MNINHMAALQKENTLLNEQIQQLKYYLTGSMALQQRVDDCKNGDTIYCAKEKIHEIAAGMLEAADVCVDIGPGRRPQRLLKPVTHLLVEPNEICADELVRRFPQKLVINMDGLSYMKAARDKSVDTIFLLDVIEQLGKEDGQQLIVEARRVARKQIVIFTPLGVMPSENAREADTSCSYWTPEEFEDSISIVSEDYHQRTKGEFGAFYSIISCTTFGPAEKAIPTRLILLSEPAPNFEFEYSDIIIADVSFSEFSWLMSNEPKHNCLYVPLNLIAEHRAEPVEVLRGTMINFRQMEEYVKVFTTILPIGVAAQEVLSKIKAAIPTVYPSNLNDKDAPNRAASRETKGRV